MKVKKQTASKEISEGIVIKNTGSSYIVRTDCGNEITCRVKGNFRIKGIRSTNPVAVGDRVTVTKSADDADYITAIAPRKNYISEGRRIFLKNRISSLRILTGQLWWLLYVTLPLPPLSLIVFWPQLKRIMLRQCSFSISVTCGMRRIVRWEMP